MHRWLLTLILLLLTACGGSEPPTQSAAEQAADPTRRRPATPTTTPAGAEAGEPAPESVLDEPPEPADEPPPEPEANEPVDESDSIPESDEVAEEPPPPADALTEPQEETPPDDSGAELVAELKDEIFFGVGGFTIGCGALPPPADMPFPGISHTAGSNQICLWDFPLGEPIALRLTSPDGRAFAATYTTVKSGSAGDFSSRRLDPPPPPDKNVAGIAQFPQSGPSIIGINLRWPLNLPRGDWKAEAKSSGASAKAVVPVPPPNFRTVSVVPSEAPNPFLNTCEDNAYGVGDTIRILGADFPPGQAVAIGVYFGGSSTAVLQLVYAAPLTADGAGRFATDVFPESSDPEGQYWAIAISDAENAFLQTDSEAPASYNGARDCFTIRH